MGGLGGRLYVGMELSDEGGTDYILCGSTVYCYMGWGVAMKRIHVQRLAHLNVKHGG